MAIEKLISTRIVLTHDEYAALKDKTLKAGEVVLAKVGTTEADGKVTQPIWMMKVGDGESTVANCPWLVAPAADVYEWAKKSSLAVEDIPTLPIAKIDGLQDALDGKADDDHNHDNVYKKLQTAVDEAGANNQTLKISQDTQGKITVTPIDISIVHTQVSDFDTTVKNIVTEMGIAGSEEVAGLAGRISTAEGDIDDLDERMTEAEGKITEIAIVVSGAAAEADEALGKINAFMDANAASDETVDTLKEIIALIESEDAEVSSALLAEINALKEKFNADGKALEAVNADTVDGKHADDFATKEQGAKADTALQAVKDATDDNLVIFTEEGKIADSGIEKGKLNAYLNVLEALVPELNSIESNNIIVGGTDNYVVDSGVSIDAITTMWGDYNAAGGDGIIAGTADAIRDIYSQLYTQQVYDITVDEATGLKVTKSDPNETGHVIANISFMDDVVFVLNGGTASNLD